MFVSFLSFPMALHLLRSHLFSFSHLSTSTFSCLLLQTNVQMFINRRDSTRTHLINTHLIKVRMKRIISTNVQEHLPKGGTRRQPTKCPRRHLHLCHHLPLPIIHFFDGACIELDSIRSSQPSNGMAQGWVDQSRAQVKGQKHSLRTKQEEVCQDGRLHHLGKDKVMGTVALKFPHHWLHSSSSVFLRIPRK